MIFGLKSGWFGSALPAIGTVSPNILEPVSRGLADRLPECGSAVPTCGRYGADHGYAGFDENPPPGLPDSPIVDRLFLILTLYHSGQASATA